MNYYEHHLGDYIRDTTHLSLLEHGVYRCLIDAYYIRERPLPLDQREIFRIVRATGKNEREAVVYVLKEFFELKDDGYHQRRVDREIARFQGKSAKARASADARWKSSERNANASGSRMRTHGQTDANAMPTQCEGNALQTPISNPQSPVTSIQSPGGGARERASASSPTSPPGSNGKHRAPRNARTRIPESFDLSPERKQYAIEKGVDPVATFELFRAYWLSSGGLKADWDQTWRTWVLKDAATRAERDRPRKTNFELTQERLSAEADDDDGNELNQLLNGSARK